MLPTVKKLTFKSLPTGWWRARCESPPRLFGIKGSSDLSLTCLALRSSELQVQQSSQPSSAPQVNHRLDQWKSKRFPCPRPTDSLRNVRRSRRAPRHLCAFIISSHFRFGGAVSNEKSFDCDVHDSRWRGRVAAIRRWSASGLFHRGTTNVERRSRIDGYPALWTAHLRAVGRILARSGEEPVGGSVREEILTIGQPGREGRVLENAPVGRLADLTDRTRGLGSGGRTPQVAAREGHRSGRGSQTRSILVGTGSRGRAFRHDVPHDRG